MRQMRAAGATLQSIGDYFDVTREAVRRSLNRVEKPPKIGTIINVWNKMKPISRAAFLAAIDAKLERRR
jgi:hypothetical protein